MTIQPQTLARRSSNGAAASPDIARLKGARLVTMPEPEKGLKLDAALVKQVTGGDSVSGRLLFQNPIEFKPEFKIYINTNHLPKISDSTVFASGRIKVIPFNRHFEPDEQDKGLKKELRKPENMSGILNWLIEGYQMLQDDIAQNKSINVPGQINAATENYQTNASIYSGYIDDFFNENIEKSGDAPVKTSEIYEKYSAWAKNNDVSPVRIQDFVAELRNRYKVTRDREKGNVVNVRLKKAN
jgi:putative DNA primase/helicase